MQRASLVLEQKGLVFWLVFPLHSHELEAAFRPYQTWSLKMTKRVPFGFERQRLLLSSPPTTGERRAQNCDDLRESAGWGGRETGH